MQGSGPVECTDCRDIPRRLGWAWSVDASCLALLTCDPAGVCGAASTWGGPVKLGRMAGPCMGDPVLAGV